MMALEGWGFALNEACSRCERRRLRNIYLCFNSVHIPHALFQATGFFQNAFLSWWEKKEEHLFFQFPIFLNDG